MRPLCARKGRNEYSGLATTAPCKRACAFRIWSTIGVLLQEKLGAFNEDIRVNDKLNGIYDSVNLFSVFTGALYFSVNIFTTFRENGPLVDKGIVFLFLSWFSVELWTVAQVYEEVRNARVQSSLLAYT